MAAKRIRLGLCSVGILGAIGVAPTFGQEATVVQLPTFSFFTVSTSVSVPDSGRGFLGGIRRSSTGSTAFSPPRLIAHPRELDRLTALADARATIHPPMLDDTQDDLVRIHERRAAAVRAARHSTADRPQGSVAEARRLRQAETMAQAAEAESFYNQAQEMERLGKLLAARAFYRSAASKGEGRIRRLALERLQELLDKASTARASTAKPKRVTRE